MPLTQIHLIIEVVCLSWRAFEPKTLPPFFLFTRFAPDVILLGKPMACPLDRLHHILRRLDITLGESRRSAQEKNGSEKDGKETAVHSEESVHEIRYTDIRIPLNFWMEPHQPSTIRIHGRAFAYCHRICRRLGGFCHDRRSRTQCDSGGGGGDDRQKEMGGKRTEIPTAAYHPCHHHHRHLHERDEHSWTHSRRSEGRRALWQQCDRHHDRVPHIRHDHLLGDHSEVLRRT